MVLPRPAIPEGRAVVTDMSKSDKCGAGLQIADRMMEATRSARVELNHQMLLGKLWQADAPLCMKDKTWLDSD